MNKDKIKKYLKPAVIIFILIYVATFLTHLLKPMPEGLDVSAGPFQVPSERVEFLADHTFVNEHGERESEHEIFDRKLELIEESESLVVADMFLFNSFQSAEPQTHRELSRELAAALEEKAAQPETKVVLITDPLNDLYGGLEKEMFQDLQRAGVEVVITDLKPLPDSNPIYSSLWRMVFQWWGNSPGGVWPNLLDHDGERLPLRSYLKMLNFKANHRKVLLTDARDGEDDIRLRTIITSANPQDASGAHSNVGFLIDDVGLGQAVWSSEKAAAELSGKGLKLPESLQEGLDSAEEYSDTPEEELLLVYLLTENQIKSEALELINSTEAGHHIDMKMFYLADRQVINALVEAEERGVAVRIILDPNQTAFGRERSGIPNLPVANEIKQRSGDGLDIRWCNTLGEQCHSKLLVVDKGEEAAVLTGSANFTRRNLNNYNLESNVLIRGSRNSAPITESSAFFINQWYNLQGRSYTISFEDQAKESGWRYGLYYFMERTGLNTF